jgi:hypothetical protein
VEQREEEDGASYETTSIEESNSMHIAIKIFLSLLMLISCRLNSLYAQDVEPRRWSTLPLHTKIIGAGYGFTTGEVFFDPFLQVENSTVQMNSLLATYIHPFKIGTKLARLDVKVPFGIVHYEGLLNGEPATLNRNGFLDPSLRFSINLLGPPALNIKELQKYYVEHPVYTTLGVSMGVTLPFGQYFDEKLINLGQNRFVFRPQLGLLHNWGLWSYELTGSVYVFTNNNNFYDGGLRKQDPIFALQTHLIKRFPSRFWGSASLALGHGGESVINNIPKNDTRTDFIGALSVGFPLTKFQNVKVVYLHTEALTDIGANTNSFIFGWSLLLL